MMEKAILADKKNPLPMYQKANILLSLEKFDEALEVLEELKEYAPRESGVYALMGKIYKRRNMHEKAMLHFGLALDLKPSATDVATIKVIGYSLFIMFVIFEIIYELDIYSMYFSGKRISWWIVIDREIYLSHQNLFV